MNLIFNQNEWFWYGSRIVLKFTNFRGFKKGLNYFYLTHLKVVSNEVLIMLIVTFLHNVKCVLLMIRKLGINRLWLDTFVIRAFLFLTSPLSGLIYWNSNKNRFLSWIKGNEEHWNFGRNLLLYRSIRKKDLWNRPAATTQDPVTISFPISFTFISIWINTIT